MRSDDHLDLRRAIVSACRSLNALGLNQGTSGNISIRIPDGLLLTPSGLPYDAMDPSDIVLMRADGSHEGRLRPSTEWRIHRDILLARPEIGAVVHAHPTYATAFAMCRREIPAVHYMIAAAGGPTIRCGDYATFGTAELSAAALAALDGRACCLLANHGLVATGRDLDRAMWLAVETEALCRQYAVALSVGAPVILPDDEIARTMALFASYGPRAKAEAAPSHAPHAEVLAGGQPRSTHNGGASFEAPLRGAPQDEERGRRRPGLRAARVS